MSAENTGRQSPEPERQSGSQQQDAPSTGTGVNDNVSNKEQSKKDIEALESNPKPILDEHRLATTSKTVNHPENASKA